MKSLGGKKKGREGGRAKVLAEMTGRTRGERVWAKISAAFRCDEAQAAVKFYRNMHAASLI